MIQTNAYSTIAMKTKINRPSASPANVEAATVQGQKTPWFDIKDAPHDGTTIVGAVFKDNGKLLGVDLFSWGSWDEDNSKRYSGWQFESGHLDPNDPTHWLPASLSMPGSAVGTVAAPSDSPSPKSENSGAVAELVEAAAQVDDLIYKLLPDCKDLAIKQLRSALEVVKTDLAFSHNTESTKE